MPSNIIRIRLISGEEFIYKHIDDIKPEYYDSIIDLIDGLVEAYQGKEGLIQVSGIGTLDKNNDIKNIINYFETLCNMVAKLRKNPKLQDSWIQNDIDTVVSLLYKTKYKLVNHQ
jgi:hypothetical protein